MTKVLAVIGHAYSGSTLFGLALGQHYNIVCLGEVMFHENDYSESSKCTCGEKLVDCEFWQKAKIHLEREQSDLPDNLKWELSKKSGLCEIDRRGGWKKLPVVLGYPLNKIFGKEKTSLYKHKNELFFKSMASLVGEEKVLLDLSKLPERVELMHNAENIDLYCVYLKRAADQVFASTMKRPKRTRAKFGFKVIREAVWFNLRKRHIEHTLNKISDDKKIEVDYEEFIKNPKMVLSQVFNWLDLDKSPSIFEEKKIDINKQHLYVGNRWLFRQDQQSVIINSHQPNKMLQRTELLKFKIISFFFGNKV